MRNEKYSVIGSRQPMIDSIPKATGYAQYTADLSLPGMLVGKLLRSPYPHARVPRVDTPKALSLLGVKAV